MEDLVGYGFRPTDDELVGFYLHNKIQGNTWLVEGAINEVNICDFDPWNLCFQSKIKSKDRVWYFFSRRKNKYGTGDRQNRKTPSGKWKLTGVPTVVMDHLGRCGIRGKIGHKRCLEFVNSVTGLDDKWVIHEYHNTVVLPEHLRTTYVICRLEYKGDDISILSANAIDPTPFFVANMTNSEGSVVNQSQYDNIYSEDDSTNHGQHLNGYFNMPDQVPYSVSYDGGRLRIWDYEVDFNTDQSLHELLPDERTSMQENRNVCIPKKPVTGYLIDDSSNSDTDSMFGSDNSSGTDSVGEAPSTKTVKQKWIVLEKISQRNSQWIYLKNMIIGFLLFISVIRWIILV